MERLVSKTMAKAIAEGADIRRQPPRFCQRVEDNAFHHCESRAKIEWNDWTESIPAFLIIVGIPFSYSIADGLALGFISYAVVKGFSGRAREISWLTYLLAIVLVVYFVFVRSRMG